MLRDCDLKVYPFVCQLTERQQSSVTKADEEVMKVIEDAF